MEGGGERTLSDHALAHGGMISPITPTFEPSGRVTWAVWMTSTPVLRQAGRLLKSSLESGAASLIDCPIDYRENEKFSQALGEVICQG
jgi:hypothetical protein